MQFVEVPPFRTTVIRLLEGDLFVYCEDANGGWVDWPNLYCVASLRPTALSLRAMRARMDAVCQFHNWAALRGVDTRARVEGVSFFTKEEIEALRQELRGNLLARPASSAHGGRRAPNGGRRAPERRVVTNGQWGNRCAAVRDYVAWHAELVIQRMSVRDERLSEARQRLADFRTWMSLKARSHRNVANEGMDEAAHAVFLKAITPGDPTNPFAERHQHRNYALWLTYYDAGIRRSEALGLKGEDLHLHGSDPKIVVQRRPDDPDDTRASPANTKTLPHDAMLTPRLSAALHTYMVKHRTKIRGAKKLPYVFLSQEGRPLSLQSVHYMVQQLRQVPGIPPEFTTHILRYGWNDRFGAAAEELKLSADHEEQVRNRHQGWTPTSKQGQQYQRRRNREKAQAIGLHMQDSATKGAA